MSLDQNFENWKKIWEKREVSDSAGALTLDGLLKANGYDNNNSSFSEKDWLKMTERLKAKLNIQKGDSIFELGCGAGAFLLPFYNMGCEVSGIDYADNLIEIAKKAMPNGDFQQAEAIDVPYADAKFDHAMSFGVFFYFSNLEYAEKALTEMLRVLKPGGTGAIMDINDKAKEQDYVAWKKAKIGEERYKELYSDHLQLFFEREWFKEMSEKYHLSFEIEEQSLENYGNGDFRFNFFFTKL